MTSRNGLSLSLARVERPGQPAMEKAAILVRLGKATVKTGRGVPIVALEKDGVTAVDRTSPKQWTVTFDSGEMWTVTRDKGCGCGGG